MQKISIKDVGEYKAVPILRGLISAKPEGCDLDEYRRRVRVLRVLDKADGDTMMLEDADALTLATAIRSCRTYSVIAPEVLEILEAAMAGEPVD